MNKFVWQPDETLVFGDVPLKPRTARDVFRDLNVEDSSDTVKYQAVKQWLYFHASEVDPLLRMSLVQAGFAPEVKPVGEQIKTVTAQTFTNFLDVEDLQRADVVNLIDALRLSLSTSTQRREDTPVLREPRPLRRRALWSVSS